jgi:hypothetical protein
VAELTADWPFRPFLPTFWEEAVRQRSRTPLLGERLVAARRHFERSWGCANFELPLSHLCATPTFSLFAHHVLSNLGRFHEGYNGAVREYRRRHGIRSRNHPVPDLGHDGEWLEAPFWAWRAGAGRRSRLFVRRDGGRLSLRVGGESWPDLPATFAADRWSDMERAGLKVRTRALTTTLYARLFLADLFIHGIGGGKYDELTDVIVRRFFNVEPPDFLVLTGTLRLPLPSFPAGPDDLRAARRLTRDVYWNPQRHLSERAAVAPAVRAAVARRGQVLASVPQAPAGRRTRFRQLRAAADLLRPHAAPDPERAKRTEEGIAAEVAANAVLRRRDYAFCLYPEAELRAFFAGTSFP